MPPRTLSDEDMVRLKAMFSDTLDDRLVVHDQALGIDSSTFEGREKFRLNLVWVDDARQGTQAVKKNLIRGFVGTLGTGLAYVAWAAIHAPK